MPVSVRLAPELNQQVADIAAALDCPKSWVIEQAIKDFVAVQAWHLAAEVLRVLHGRQRWPDAL